jgi:hypothetical protein
MCASSMVFFVLSNTLKYHRPQLQYGRQVLDAGHRLGKRTVTSSGRLCGTA